MFCEYRNTSGNTHFRAGFLNVMPRYSKGVSRFILGYIQSASKTKCSICGVFSILLSLYIAFLIHHTIASVMALID